MIKYFILLLLLLSTCEISFSQEYKLCNLRNCQRELRTVTFQNQVDIFWKCVSNQTTIRKQHILHFGTDYKLDTIFFENQIEKIRKTLPTNFFQTLFAEDDWSDWYDNIPDEKAIWVIEIFAQKNSTGSFKVYSAVKIIFKGTNTVVDEQRINPQIEKIEFIFDKQQLKILEAKLKDSPKSN
jgi:hypothetical protein